MFTGLIPTKRTPSFDMLFRRLTLNQRGNLNSRRGKRLAVISLFRNLPLQTIKVVVFMIAH